MEKFRDVMVKDVASSAGGHPVATHTGAIFSDGSSDPHLLNGVSHPAGERGEAASNPSVRGAG